MARISPFVVIGKTIRTLARLRGGGSALPGLVLERLQPTFLRDSLGQLPLGVVLVTGTNGKTTTTKMIVELLRADGLRVLTNPSGSNFTRGIVASIIEMTNLDGTLDFDIAVIELDEAYAKQFVSRVKPAYVLALNVMRDQLDRFGEIETAAKMLKPVIESATKACVVNRDDPLLVECAAGLDSKDRPVHYFSVAPSLQAMFPSDDELQMRGVKPKIIPQASGDVELESIDGQSVTYLIGRTAYSAHLKLTGAYNFQNGAAALAMVRAILPEPNDRELISNLSEVSPAFGRGELLEVHGQPLQLVLVKNPAGFRLSLQSYIKPNRKYMIAINDNYADGRDMSWLWDVDFSGPLTESGVAMVSGQRAYDMALRLQYDEVLFNHVEPKIPLALKTFLLGEASPKVIFCTYTAMLNIRKELKQFTDVERVL